MQATSQNTVEHFDEAEVREIAIDDKDYPELLKGIQKPPNVAIHPRIFFLQITFLLIMRWNIR